MKFRVDIGETYESGRVVEVTARTPEDAYKVASTECRGEEFVQQIFDKQFHCYYDWMNGFAIYK